MGFRLVEVLGQGLPKCAEGDLEPHPDAKEQSVSWSASKYLLSSIQVESRLSRLTQHLLCCQRCIEQWCVQALGSTVS